MRRLLPCLCLCLSCLLSTAVLAGDFNFSYRAVGDPELKPAQIFDDGRKTYFQMRGLQVAPAVFAELPDGLHLLDIEQKGGYLVAPTLANAFVLRFGQLRGRVTYSGEKRPLPPLPAAGVASPVASPGVKAQASYIAPPATFGAAVPLSGDPDSVRFVERDVQIAFAEGSSRLGRESAIAVTTALGRTADIAAVVITGRGDALQADGLARARAMAIRDRILNAGVPMELVSIREGSPQESSRLSSRSDLSVTWRRLVPSVSARVVHGPSMDERSSDWERPLEEPARQPDTHVSQHRPSPALAATKPEGYVLKKDQLIHVALQEWARAAGWELVWRYPKSWRTVADAHFGHSGDVSVALSEVIRILRDEGKPLRLHISEGNRVMEVVSDEVRHD